MEMRSALWLRMLAHHVLQARTNHPKGSRHALSALKAIIAQQVLLHLCRALKAAIVLASASRSNRNAFRALRELSAPPEPLFLLHVSRVLMRQTTEWQSAFSVVKGLSRVSTTQQNASHVPEGTTVLSALRVRSHAKVVPLTALFSLVSRRARMVGQTMEREYALTT